MAKIQLSASQIHEERTLRQLRDPYREHLDSLDEEGLIERNEKYIKYKNEEYDSTDEAFLDVFNGIDGAGVDFFCPGLENFVSQTKLIDLIIE